jgi:hypothetical protein
VKRPKQRSRAGQHEMRQRNRRTPTMKSKR